MDSPARRSGRGPAPERAGRRPGVVADDKDPGILGTYRRCLPAACIADADIKDELIKKLRGLSESGKLQFKDGAQQEIAIPVSFKGFGQAYDAMQKP